MNLQCKSHRQEGDGIKLAKLFGNPSVLGSHHNSKNWDMLFAEIQWAEERVLQSHKHTYTNNELQNFSNVNSIDR